ncbi:MBL fold metallo-hydrolase [Ruegeria meonggei]|uniref:MBL fold metallo-hydrolase n=1 Tax=Ruegeria meonggei TaxID=1446476 RepID=UPI001356327C|nr:MBL fold metallo-hydrolase [Ruegeria meonggei]
MCLVTAGYAGLIWHVYLRDSDATKSAAKEIYKYSPELNVIPLGNGFFVLRGAGGNITISTGPDGTLLIDSGDVEMTDSVLAALETIDALDVNMVINTHSHGDHRGGNATFSNKGAEIIAHRATYENIKADTYTAFEIESLPTFVFDTDHTFTFNEQDITLTHIPMAHTNGDIIAHFKEADIIAAGDVLILDQLPFISIGSGASLSGHLAGLQVLLSHVDETTTIVPGNGAITVGPTALQETHDHLQKIHDYLIWLKSHNVTTRFVLLFHPLYSWPVEKRKGQGWEKFWVRMIYATLPDTSL